MHTQKGKYICSTTENIFVRAAGQLLQHGIDLQLLPSSQLSQYVYCRQFCVQQKKPYCNTVNHICIHSYFEMNMKEFGKSHCNYSKLVLLSNNS